MEGVREGGTFEGVGDPAEQKTILEPPEPDGAIDGDPDPEIPTPEDPGRVSDGESGGDI